MGATVLTIHQQKLERQPERSTTKQSGVVQGRSQGSNAVSQLMRLQQTIGNRAVTQLIRLQQTTGNPAVMQLMQSRGNAAPVQRVGIHGQGDHVFNDFGGAFEDAEGEQTAYGKTVRATWDEMGVEWDASLKRNEIEALHDQFGAVDCEHEEEDENSVEFGTAKQNFTDQMKDFANEQSFVNRSKLRKAYATLMNSGIDHEAIGKLAEGQQNAAREAIKMLNNSSVALIGNMDRLIEKSKAKEALADRAKK